MPEEKRRRVLEPTERFSEILFGLIMVLTFTGSLSAASSGREEVRTMLIGAIGCNLAWGIVDAIMYVMNSLAERGREPPDLPARSGTPRAPRRAPGLRRRAPARRRAGPRRRRGLELDAPAPRGPARAAAGTPRSSGDDLLAALAVFLLVFLSTFPVVIPFLFMHDADAGPARLQRDRDRPAPLRRLRVRRSTRASDPGGPASSWSRSASCSSRSRSRSADERACAGSRCGGPARAAPPPPRRRRARRAGSEAEEPRLGVQRERLRLLPAGGHGLRPADRHRRPRRAAPGGPLQLRGDRHRLRWVGWNVGVGRQAPARRDAHGGRGLRRNDGRGAGLRADGVLGLVRALQRGRVRLRRRGLGQQLLLQLGPARLLPPRLAVGRPRVAAHADVPDGPRRAARVPRRLQPTRT